MKNRIFSAFLAACSAAICFASWGAVYDPMSGVPAVPPNAGSKPARPAIMLNMSRDHQLFYKAYNEFSDYDGDGKLDGGYIHNVNQPYSGYFDPGKCYVYDLTDKLFSPSKLAGGDYLCGGGTWSGNFLNWATMTRMDIVRKVLYGGYRRTDPNERATGDASRTILERVGFPMDAHSFAKHYKYSSGGSKNPALSSITPFANTVTEISICNTTVDDNSAWSHSTTAPPLMRVVSGNYSLWAAHERRQCRWFNESEVWKEPGRDNGNVQDGPDGTGYEAESAYPTRPTGANFGDLVVRVEVCKSDLLGGERCKQYPKGNWKPIGLLQEFGEKDQAQFGLLTGSFSNNIKGGILRKNVSSFTNEVNLTNGVFRSGVNGIVGTLNKLRIFGYRYADSKYLNDPIEIYNAERDADSDVDVPDSSFCRWRTIGLSNGTCMSWGNPIGEMFIESLRYFKRGLRPAVDYGDNSDVVGADWLGLPHNVSWKDPLAADASGNYVFGRPHCRAINIINFNASVISYDGDTLGPFSDLGSDLDLTSYVNQIGRGEDVHGKKWFFGDLLGDSDRDNLCTAKSINNLSNVEGLCPYAPGYRGSFSLAGAAYWAHTHSLRPPVTTGAQQFKDPNFRVNTFSVELAPGVPRIELTVAGDKKVIIQPSYRLHDPIPYPADDDKGRKKDPLVNGTGTLVDFRVITHDPSTGGKYLVIWEDSEQGGDFDQDVAGILEWYFINEKKDISVKTRIYNRSTSRPQGFGYTISGTDRDGAHFHSGIDNFKFNDPTKVTDALRTRDCSEGCNFDLSETTATYKITGGTGGVLKDPMYWAAKWGGFTVDSANDVPTKDVPTKDESPSNWDIRDEQGNSGTKGDGSPDNYFLVFNPSDLESALRRAFSKIVVTSNAAPSVSSSQLITGSRKYVAEFSSDDPISGNVKAFSLDDKGCFNAKLVDKKCLIKKEADWDIGKRLSDVSYNAALSIHRQVITNAGKDGLDFTWSGIGESHQNTLKSALRTKLGNPVQGDDAAANRQAAALVNYVRGDPSNENAGYYWRPRTTGNVRNILGPVVNAAPWFQSTPSALYFDGTFTGYSDFSNLWKSRTELLWVASNDGMVHAVNAATGRPVISYLPGVLMPRLVEQIESKNGVVPFVDGSPFTGDVKVIPQHNPNDDSKDVSGYKSQAKVWRTYLFGSLGRGGRAFYALDVTIPRELTAENAEKIFKWQFTADDDSDLGYVLSEYSIKRSSGQASPIVKLNNGQFAIITGNGYKSQDGKAALMILAADGPGKNGKWDKGSDYYKILADADPEGGNGLSTPTWVDTDNDGTADFVYAGDLKGRLWKFDISSTKPSEWKVSFSERCGGEPPDVPTCNPLFDRADGRTIRPITTAPEVILASTAGGTMPDYMVTFGTGASFDDGLFPTEGTNRMYSIWDRANFKESNGRSLPRGTATLVRRLYERQAGGNVTNDSRDDIVDYTNLRADKAKDGWYAELPGKSEMIVSNPIRLAQYVAMVSIRPNLDGDSCSALPEATLYLVNPVTGLPPMVSSTNYLFGSYMGNPVVGIHIDDQKVAIALDKTSRSASPGLVSPSGRSVKFRVMGNGTGESVTDIVGELPGIESRLQWREIPGLRTR